MIYGGGKLGYRHPVALANPLSEVPVLAIQAVKRTTIVKDRKVFIPMLRSLCVCIVRVSRARAPGTHPIGNTVSRQGIADLHWPLLCRLLSCHPKQT